MIKLIQVYDVIPTNSYVYLDESGHGFLIDPGAEGERLVGLIMENGWTIEKILISHGHYDHIGGINALRRSLDIPVIAGLEAKKYFEDPYFNISSQFGRDYRVKIGKDDQFLPEGSLIVLSTGGISLRLIETPGHTEDGCSYYDEKGGICFVGDTIFQGSIGRTDMPGGDSETIERSIRNKIYTLPDDTDLLSGHSMPTKVGFEKKYGYFR